jgi:site-specific DNA-methyltransferase (adenine-specific)/modification methylase
MAEKIVIGNAELWHGDCREVLPMLKPVDAVITDPPYGIGANKQTLGKGKKDFDRGGDWDAERPDLRWIPSAARWFCVWGGNYFADMLPVTNDILVWHKRNDGRSFSECEFAWTNSGRQSRIKSHHWSGEEKEHPTQKPLPVMAWCVSIFPEARYVLDPFMGSGTTGVACAQLGKVFTGIERERRYFDIACERIARAQSQGHLLPPAPEDKPVQESIL